MKYTKVFFALCVLFLIGCKSSTKYDLLLDESKISMIQIVEVGEYDHEKYEFELRKVVEISDIEWFLDDFGKIQCRNHYSAPLDLEQDSVVVKIMYESGEYELISWYAQSIHTNDGVNYGNYELDEKSFFELIRKYSNKENVKSDVGEKIVAEEMKTLPEYTVLEDCEFLRRYHQFPVDINEYMVEFAGKRVENQEDAMYMGERILELCHEDGRFLDEVLINIAYSQEENVWLFEYSIDQRDTPIDELIEYGSTYIAIDGDNSELLVAWIEEG